MDTAPADHNPIILAIHDGAVVPNKRVALTVLSHKTGNSVLVGYREDPNRWGGMFGQAAFGEIAADRRVHACTWVAADRRAEYPVDRGCPEGHNKLHVVVITAGKDVTAARPEEGRIDDSDSRHSFMTC